MPLAATESVPAADLFTSVLLPTDLGVDGLSAFAHALRLALDARAGLTLLHVASDEVPWASFPGIRTTLIRWGVLAEGVDRGAVAGLGIRAQKLKLEVRNPVRGILHRAQKGKADLILMASHPRKMRSRLGNRSVSEDVARSASVPCLVLPVGARGFVQLEDGRVTLRRATVIVPPGAPAGPAYEALGRLVRTLRVPALEVTWITLGRGGTVELPDVDGMVFDRRRSAGTVAEVTREALAKGRPDLLVLASSGGGRGWFSADPLTAVLREAKVPVLVAPVAR